MSKQGTFCFMLNTYTASKLDGDLRRLRLIFSRRQTVYGGLNDSVLLPEPNRLTLSLDHKRTPNPILYDTEIKVFCRSITTLTNG